MINSRSLVFRLVAWHALWLAAAFALAGSLLFFGARHYLESRFAGIQADRARRVGLLVTRRELADPAALGKVIASDFAPEASERFIRISLPGGAVAYESDQPFDRSFDVRDISAPQNRAGVRLEKLPDDSQMMIATEAVGPAGAPVFFVETGESFTPGFEELDRLLISLAVGFGVVALAGVVGGHRLIRGTLKPIDAITSRAESITSSNLSERLPVPKSGAEFEHLSLALNRMIARLDDEFQQKRRFLADASHELRTPLTILRGELEALAKAPTLPAEHAAEVDALLPEVDRLARIVEGLFTISRLESGFGHAKHARFDFARLVAATTEQMELLAMDKAMSIACVAPAPVFVNGDSSRLKQVVVNLLDNAIKYTPVGGFVSLSVFARDGEAVCEVVDTGIGIPAEAIPRIFDRFYRGDEARSLKIDGAGLGLAIVKSVSNAHGGMLEVDSIVGKGSCFRLRLPLASAEFSGPVL